MSEQPKTKRQLAAERRANVAARTPRVPLFVIFNDKVHSLTPAGLALVTDLAREGCGQQLIAARVGIPFRSFKRLLGSGEDRGETRAAWELGHSEHDQAIAQKFLAMADKGNVVSLIWYSKNRCQWSDVPQAAQQTNNVTITLPAPMDKATWFKMVGVPDPSATAKDITAAVEVTSLPAPSPSPTNQTETQPKE